MTSATAELESHIDTEHEVEEHSGPSYDDINIPVVVMVGLISIILTICTIFFVQGLTYHWQNSYVRERSYDFVNEPALQIVAEQRQMLQGDTEKGIKPIDETMEEIIAKYGKKQ